MLNCSRDWSRQCYHLCRTSLSTSVTSRPLYSSSFPVQECSLPWEHWTPCRKAKLELQSHQKSWLEKGIFSNSRKRHLGGFWRDKKCPECIKYSSNTAIQILSQSESRRVILSGSLTEQHELIKSRSQAFFPTSDLQGRRGYSPLLKLKFCHYSSCESFLFHGELCKPHPAAHLPAATPDAKGEMNPVLWHVSPAEQDSKTISF